jgi:hypothetical protein
MDAITLKSLSTIIGIARVADQSTSIRQYVRMLPFCIFAADISDHESKSIR